MDYLRKAVIQTGSILTVSLCISTNALTEEAIPHWVFEDNPITEESIADEGNNYQRGSGTNTATPEKGTIERYRPLTNAELASIRPRHTEAKPALQAAGVATQIYRNDALIGSLAEIQSEVALNGLARVLVTLRPPADTPDTQLLPEAVALVPSVGESIIAAGGEVIKRFTQLPVLVINADQSVLNHLMQLEAVAGMELDIQGTTSHESTMPLIGADVLNAHSTDGAGYEGEDGRWSVAVLDNGIRASHEAFTGKIEQESCFVTDNSCPNGENSQVGSGAASDGCGSASLCNHGTHVAGTVLGEFTNTALLTNDGVAPGAGLYVVDVNNSSNTWYLSSVVAGLEHILIEVQNGARIAAVNMSLNSFALYNGNCDTNWPSGAAAVDALVNEGVTVIAASGNNSSTTELPYPACFSNVLSVGSTSNLDVVSSYTNSNDLLDLWAPGENVQSAGHLSDTDIASWSGTSMASAHAAGAAAAIAECLYNSTDRVADTLTALASGGVPVTRGGLTRPRLDISGTASLLVATDFSQRYYIYGTSGTDLYSTMCTTAEPMEPHHRPHGSPGYEATTGGTWYTYVIPENGTYEFDTCDETRSFDTVLAAYSGSTLSALTRVAANDDSCELGSRIAVQGTTGQEIHINVSGYGTPDGSGDTGIYTLTWNQTGTELVSCDGKIATMLGTGESDLIVGSALSDVIVSGGGNDEVYAMECHDTICLGDGDDYAYGSFGYDVVLGGDGTDSIHGGPNSDKLHGGAGGDYITGGDKSDRLFGDDGDDSLHGEAYSDLIYGGRGNDLITGGIGNDRLFGQSGADDVYGDDGDDKLYGGQSNDDLYGGDGNDRMWGETGHDRLYGELGNDSWLDGGAHNDLIYGGGGHDTIRGGDGRDRLYGQGGSDDVRAQAGDDLVTDGGPGADSCQVAPGVDVAPVNCE